MPLRILIATFIATLASACTAADADNPTAQARTAVVAPDHTANTAMPSPAHLHGNWRLVAADDPHDAALMTFSIIADEDDARGSGDYVLFQPFCDALDGRPIRGTSECESIGQGAAFARVQATPQRLLLVFHPVADGSEHRLELRRDGERLTGEYVAEANDIRRAVIAERAPDDAR